MRLPLRIPMINQFRKFKLQNFVKKIWLHIVAPTIECKIMHYYISICLRKNVNIPDRTQRKLHFLTSHYFTSLPFSVHRAACRGRVILKVYSSLVKSPFTGGLGNGPQLSGGRTTTAP